MLAINGGKKTIDDKKQHYVWPIITEKTKKAILDQLDESISIYNRSGIIKKFEEKFCKYHNIKYGLLNNSGTTSILTMYASIGIQPGDEVIVPNYTFFATATPLFILGAVPVLCDCNEDGNINYNCIENLITNKTKAIIITHMWGIPCDMDEILEIVKKHKLLLLEDCSHAHGAKYKEKNVGTFGSVSVWSLQGQKIISGGEGGILLTNNEEFYCKAQLFGHYNKRCQQEISKDYDLYEFATTGFGLKLRSHPLAVAIANEQFDNLESYLEYKEKYANYIINELKEFEFLKAPNLKNKTPSWYALVFQFDDRKSFGIPIKKFYEALLAEGLKEIDMPKSTMPLHSLPLFNKYNKIWSFFFKDIPNLNSEDFSNSVKFYNNAIKLPVWATEEDFDIVKIYAKGIKKVCSNLKELL